MTQMYYWCNLHNGVKHTAGYIEDRAAKVGNVVEMIDLDGKFWTVDTVVGSGVTKKYVRDNEMNFKGFQASLKGGGIK